MSDDDKKAEAKAKAKDKADELREKAADLKDQAAEQAADAKEKATAQAAELKDKASEKLDDAKQAKPGGIKDTAEQIAGGDGPYAGSGGDAGSGPTGDLYQPAPSGSDARSTFLMAGAALVAGFILGRLTARR